MRSLKDFNNVKRNEVLLKDFTTMKVGGPAEYFLEPESLYELREFILALKLEKIPLHILGLGSNVIASDKGVMGGIARVVGSPFDNIEFDGSTMHVGAGVILSNMMIAAENHSLSGFECLAGIPGTIGGSLVMNAGGKWGNIGDHVVSVKVIDENLRVKDLSKLEAAFGYRSSKLRGNTVIGATFELEQKDPDEISKTVVQIIEEKKKTQPLGSKSAGCIFKNPAAQSAGMIIDSLGIKGHKIGGAKISSLHANFIVNDGKAKSSDIFRLIKMIQDKVRLRNHINLYPEVEIWGTNEFEE